MKRKNIRFIVEIILIICLVIGLILINEQINDNRKKSFFPKKDDNTYAYQIESVNIEGDELVIKGWFFELANSRNVERNVNNTDFRGLLLYDISSKTETDYEGKEKPRVGIKLNTEREKRNDVNKYFNCQYDYSNSGFIARVDKSKVNLENTEYQIVIKCNQEDEYGILTNSYICGGELKHYDSENNFELNNIAGTYLEKIINNGVCIFSSKENHMCIFQDEWKLYYIVDSEYLFDSLGKTYIQVLIDTTQLDIFSEGEQYFYYNIGDYFEKSDISQLYDCGEYRVFMIELPQDYAISSILTGSRADDKWNWQHFIKPCYYFER